MIYIPEKRIIIMQFKDFIKSFNSDTTEENIIKSIFLSLLTSMILLGVLYSLRFRYIPGFVSEYGFFLLLATLSYSLILLPARYVRSYKEFPCMSGMMIGMTIGMISGFLPGFFIGATNGMFWGSVFGMAIGMSFGVANGKCCGVMGTLEGSMAGFMGGLMGAMTAIMMINDNVKFAGVIIFMVSGGILFGLNYMIYNETREMKKEVSDGDFFTIFWSFILTAITAGFMIFGPRSVLFQ